MESVEETPLYKFNPNTIEEVRKELNLDHDGIVKMLDSFEDWIVKQNHFTTKKFERHYLEMCIIYGKGSLEKAKKTLDKLCTLKTLLPIFFSKHDAKKELIETSEFHIHAVMPKLAKDNYRVHIIKTVSTDFDSEKLLDFQRFCIMLPSSLLRHGGYSISYLDFLKMCEYGKNHDYSHGFIVIIDCRDVNLINLVTKVNIVNLKNTMTVLMEGQGMRVKGIHVISSSKTVDVLITMLKHVVSEKIGGRISVLKNVEALYELVPKNILPKDYGGEEKTLKEMYENWRNVLSDAENVAFFREIFEARTDEKYRLTAKYNEQILGLPGSFRTLTVD